MLRNFLIDRFKRVRRQQYINSRESFTEQYAFIGAGNHSLGNLYPCLKDLGIQLKYICTSNISNAKKMALMFHGSMGTDHVEDILRDNEIKGVFLSLPSHLHYPTLKKLFAASKHVFVEKPPCYSINELRDLISIEKNNICLPGLQKRFCTINGLLKKKTSGATSYHYRYLSGQYPEGNPIIDIFIHPVDNVIQLFGKASISHISKIRNLDNLTVFILLNHASGVTGCLELSTDYSWNNATDVLEINNKNEILKASYPNQLTGISKPSSVFGVPIEKVLRQPIIQKVYLNNSGFLPVMENNSLVIQGFYGEVKHFVQVVEKNEPDEHTGLAGLLNVYEILEAIQTA